MELANVYKTIHLLEEFIASFAKAKEIPMFKWIERMPYGYKKVYMNIDE